MINLLKLLIKIQQKNYKRIQSKSGFTLIELLVAIVISSIILASLMGFAVNIIDSDRNEQVKATSEQEIQSALDYIAQDLAQAVYIYDNDGLSQSYNSNDPEKSGIKDEIPPSVEAPGCSGAITCVPILVFWKRETKEYLIPFTGTNTDKCDTDKIPVDPKERFCDDGFAYSLVAYYLIKGENGNERTWSNAARIGRFQITGGIVNPNAPNPQYIEFKNYPSRDGRPSEGFKEFDLSLPGSSLKNKMALWQMDSINYREYSDKVNTLIDFVDQSANDSNFQINCPSGMQKIPEFIVDGGFAACVDSTKNVAQVFIRGNALARTQNNEATPSTFNNSNASYFPTGNIQVKGRGLIGGN